LTVPGDSELLVARDAGVLGAPTTCDDHVARRHRSLVALLVGRLQCMGVHEPSVLGLQLHVVVWQAARGGGGGLVGWRKLGALAETARKESMTDNDGQTDRPTDRQADRDRQTDRR
jgi:hypothetical protein